MNLKKYPNILAFETSGPVLSVAVKKGRQKAQEAHLEDLSRHAENLLPLIARLLKKSKLSPAQVDIFLIGRGPGSFTGLRIGFATLKGFLALKKRACYGALSLDLTAGNLKPGKGDFLAVCMDARREKIYARFFKEGKGRWRLLGPPDVYGIEELIERLPHGARLAGDGCGKYAAALDEARKGFRITSEKFWYPSASNLIRAYEEQKNGKRPGILKPLRKPADFIPLYHRLSEAEERRKEHAAAC